MMAAHPKNLPYVEDFSYFKSLGYTDAQIQANKTKFIKELTERNKDLYTPQAVYQYALDEIKRLCYPKIEASVNILDISVIPDFMETPPVIGELILTHNEDNNLTLEAQVVSVNKSYENPFDINIVISNVISKGSTLRDMAETSNIVEKITDGPDNKIHGMYIQNATIGSAQIGKAVIDDAHIKNLSADKINAGTIDAKRITATVIDAINANIGEATIDSAKIDNIDAQKITSGDIDTQRMVANIINAININSTGVIKANKIEAFDIDAANIKFNVGSGGILDLQTLLSKHITGENGQFLNLTTDNVTISDAVIKDLIAKNISVEDLKTGTISTNKFNIVSDDGGIEIVGATQQFKDKNGKVRIQMGQDATGNFNFILRGEDGTTTLIDHTGIKEKAIADKLIKSNMVADNAIGEQQINYSSLVTGLNKDTNTSLIQASKVAIDLSGQSLDIAFNTLKTNVEGLDEKTETNTTAISVAQGKIDGLIKESSITKGDITTLKDNYTSIKATVEGINTTVASHTSSIGKINTDISGLSGKVSTVEDNYASLEQNLNGFKTTVANNYSTKTELSGIDGKVNGLTTRVSNAESGITQLNNKIALKVEKTDIEKAINSAKLSRADFISRNFLSTPLIVSDPTLDIYAKSGIPNPPIGAVFGSYNQKDDTIKNSGVSSNGTSWAIIIGYEFYNNTTDEDKKLAIKNRIKQVADFMCSNVSVGRFNSMNFNFIDTNYKFKSTSGQWEKSNYK